MENTRVIFLALVQKSNAGAMSAASCGGSKARPRMLQNRGASGKKCHLSSTSVCILTCFPFPNGHPSSRLPFSPLWPCCRASTTRDNTDTSSACVVYHSRVRCPIWKGCVTNIHELCALHFRIPVLESVGVRTHCTVGGFCRALEVAHCVPPGCHREEPEFQQGSLFLLWSHTEHHFLHS